MNNSNNEPNTNRNKEYRASLEISDDDMKAYGNYYTKYISFLRTREKAIAIESSESSDQNPIEK